MYLLTGLMMARSSHAAHSLQEVWHSLGEAPQWRGAAQACVYAACSVARPRARAGQFGSLQAQMREHTRACLALRHACGATRPLGSTLPQLHPALPHPRSAHVVHAMQPGPRWQPQALVRARGRELGGVRACARAVHVTCCMPACMHVCSHAQAAYSTAVCVSVSRLCEASRKSTCVCTAAPNDSISMCMCMCMLPLMASPLSPSDGLWHLLPPSCWLERSTV